MALSKDEAMGLVGQIGVLKHSIDRTERALIALIEDQFGQPGKPDISDILAFRNVIADVVSVRDRIVQEANDPDGVFGDY